MTYQYISSSLGWKTVTQARQLLKEGCVLDWGFDIAGNNVTGRVRAGDRNAVYRVELCLFDTNESGETFLSSRCACSAKRDCLHAAALSLAVLEDLQGSQAELPAGTPPEPPSMEQVPSYPAFAASWLDTLKSSLNRNEGVEAGEESVIYVLSVDRRFTSGQLQVEPRVARRLKSGSYGTDRPYGWSQLASGRARYIERTDRDIAGLWVACSPPDCQVSPARPLLPPRDPDVLALLLRRIIATGRAFYADNRHQPLKLGDAREGAVEWIVHSDARQSVEIVLKEPGLELLSSTGPWYVNPDRGEIGQVNLPFSGETLRILLASPRVTPAEAEELHAALRALNADLPLPHRNFAQEVRTDPPAPCLHLTYKHYRHRVIVKTTSGAEFIDGENAAVLSFDYGFDSSMLSRSWTTYHWLDGTTSVVSHRDAAFERRAEQRLAKLGLVQSGFARVRANESCWVAAKHDAATWLDIVREAIPLLKQEGWRITTDSSFEFRVVEPDDEWHLKIDVEAGWWFSLELGVDIEGERVSLLPVLSEVIRATIADEGSAEADLDSLNYHGRFYAPLPDGRLVSLPFARVKAILECLLEVLGKHARFGDRGLAASIPQIMALQENPGAGNIRWQADDSIQRLIAGIKSFDLQQPVDEPEGFTAALRPYQKQGLRWLEFLSAFRLGGILADDMGLGKTVQVLAHLCREKQAGTGRGPSLVVCPTSVIPNWVAEARRFVPDLRVLSLHGPERAARFEMIPRADLVVTSYALLVRDSDSLLPIEWNAVILDEAQAIKNFDTKSAQIACQLKARYRLCLTGTPIENHLGELWSQFNFLMPGFLGDRQTFKQVLQMPIEEQADQERLKLLRARVGPFLLRRNKEGVAADLPARTITITPIELEGKQRDLYETVRLSMHRRVLTEVQRRGIAASQLVILDALLKLRQVCCDPRLVKLDAASEVQESAKLEHLKAILEELVEEGRKVLLFSQFTSMLDIIAQELRAMRISFVELRGDTKDRETPVKQFQQGDIPLFLISLKAGGTGLNLTRADTVINYDPWWNPAIEEQAIGRAHRIGQDKPIFVYRLVAAGTIEQRMLELQQRKQQLAAGVLDDSSLVDAGPRFDETDLATLFAPLDDAYAKTLSSATNFARTG
ncbi:MAG TPA: DEAD/DEAH box helicase [Candidatus Obscuribacterales bacterium]